ncbi:hypothetical protein HNR19_000466 [Nocardioides thalensis]|uniref:Uncharacterized protein n=1 Tax=Nocardioides thalensis TaxID=1914755 RepID=A0A853BZG1_9ACTN|nr:hypothetical protein [Nocardioides thalensis]NYI99767.1 hypothetical protein [Nocardioides thalensis]
MNDLTDRLAGLDTSAAGPTEETVSADLARGSAALARRRRTRAAGAGVGLTLALGVGLGIAVVVQPDDDATPPSAGPSSTAPGVALVAWEGDQPVGFIVDQVPDGFFVQGSDPWLFTVAPEGDTTHPAAFEDKLVVTLETVSNQPPPGDVGEKVTRLKDGSLAYELGPSDGQGGSDAPPTLSDGDPVDVDGQPGVIRRSPDSLSTTLEFMTERGKVVVQMWKTVGLTDAQLVDFGAGITVTEEAQGSVG